MLRRDEDKGLEAGFWVGPYLVEPELHRVTKNGAVSRVEPKVMQVLVCLAERPGKVVAKDTFMERVWTDTVVTEDALLRCISELRKIFEDDVRAPRFIETIRTRGYRLIAPVFLMAEHPEGQGESSPEERGENPEAVSDQTGGEEVQWRLVDPSLVAAGLAFLAILAGALLGLRQMMTVESTLPVRTRPLTSFPGEEVDPAWAPQGNRVAFAWNGKDSLFNIYVKQVGTETLLQITSHSTHAAHDRNPAWSPDGKHLAFVRSRGSESSIFIISSMGGHPRKVKTLAARDVQKLAWSPDGSMLAFSAHMAPYEAFSLFLLPLETLEERQLTTPPADYRGDLNPAFSPDGRLLAFRRSAIEKMDDVYVVPVQGGTPQRLTHDNAEVTGLDWSKDGGHVVFSSNRKGNRGLWRISASGGTPVWVASLAGGNIHQPAVSHRGQMAFVHRSDETNLWSVDLEQENRQARSVIASTRRDANPHISPDGTRIAFASDRSGSHEIWIADRDGSRPRQLTYFDGYVTGSPRWSPGSDRVAFVSRQEGSAHIYVVDVAGGVPRRLTPLTSNDKAPNWSRNGQSIYFASNRSGSWQTWKMPAAGGKAVRVTEHGGFAAQEGPSGTFLYYVKRNTPGIWRRPIQGGDEQRIIPGLQPSDWGNWTVGRQALFFVRREAEGAVLMRYDLKTERSRPVLAMNGLPERPSLSIAPDGSQLIHTKITRSESDILIMQHLP